MLPPLSPLSPFACKATPALFFGAGEYRRLPSLLKRYGSRLLLVVGGSSFITGQEWPRLRQDLTEQGFSIDLYQIRGEPSPEDIDAICQKHEPRTIDVVVAIGGGSVLDAGKAIAAMLVERQPVITFLEGVGSRTPNGAKVPFVAVPTTSGTGSEATSNAVISRVGVDGFKRSLRHDNYIPDIALLDPSLTLGCPPPLSISCGMDTFTQLVEAYLSTKGSPLTDLLALEGIRRVVRSLEICCDNGRDQTARADMCYASYLSGIVLANAGLGAVHGLASAIGGVAAIPHGVICARLMAAANRATLKKLRETGENQEALRKYTLLGRLVGAMEDRGEAEAQDRFITYLERLTSSPHLTGLGGGLAAREIELILAGSASKNNPVQLDRDELAEILRTSWQ